MEIEEREPSKDKPRRRLINNLEQIVPYRENTGDDFESQFPFNREFQPKQLNSLNKGANQSITNNEENSLEEIDIVDLTNKEVEIDPIDQLANLVGAGKFNFESVFQSELKNASKRRTMKESKESVRRIEQMFQLRGCISKYHFKDLLEKIDFKWKFFLKFYIEDYLIRDIYNRKLEKSEILLKKRKLLLESIDDPEILETDCNFDNNSIKNFCKGFVIFYTKNLDDMEEIYMNLNKGMVIEEYDVNNEKKF